MNQMKEDKTNCSQYILRGTLIANQQLLTQTVSSKLQNQNIQNR